MPNDSPPRSIDFEEAFEAEKEYSQWHARNDAWFAQKK